MMMMAASPRSTINPRDPGWPHHNNNFHRHYYYYYYYYYCHAAGQGMTYGHYSLTNYLLPRYCFGGKLMMKRDAAPPRRAEERKAATYISIFSIDMEHEKAVKATLKQS
jgi:hypothetical protein